MACSKHALLRREQRVLGLLRLEPRLDAGSLSQASLSFTEKRSVGERPGRSVPSLSRASRAVPTLPSDLERSRAIPSHPEPSRAIPSPAPPPADLLPARGRRLRAAHSPRSTHR